MEGIMKRMALLLSIPMAALAAFAACKAASRPVPAWSVSDGLKVPESVLYDRACGFLYVSNINGAPTEKNGMGFIARLTVDGAMVDPDWVTGLNAPKGMGLRGSTLYVTDIDRFHEIDIGTGRIIKTHEVPGARFLNDIEVGSDGAVYVTDMVTNRLHRLFGGAQAVWLKLEGYENANGLYLDRGTLYVGTNQGVVKVDLATREFALYIPHAGGIDGLRPHARGFIVSDWNGKTELIAKGKPPEVILDTTAEKINAADLEYIPEKRLIIIPTFFDNRVMAYTMTN